uniref:Uncharacterized protein LOC100377660 n=1 Tax=Saccoglossus kowalevskii TaxID=10224 RepID=A0ABM0GJY5_SACKO|nr:PREDICTED: uncharacterized protein LOC100377660 [Saccoglossus kowalevskii]
MADVNKMTVPQLNNFLRKFGVSSSNYNKNILLAIAKTLHDLEPKEDHDLLHHYPKNDVATRLSKLGCNFTDPFKLPGYSSYFSNVPEFGLSDVFNYLMCHRPDYDRKKLRAYKSFEDFKLCFDGHVVDLQYTAISETSLLGSFKAKVNPMLKDKTCFEKCSYDLWFLMEKEISEVVAAYCECPGGADGKCCHVAATLYELEKKVSDGPCLWAKRPMQHVEPVAVNNHKTQVSCYEQIDTEDSEFDPRHPDDRAPISQLEQDEFMKGLAQIAPEAAVLLHLPPSESTTNSKKGVGIVTRVKQKQNKRTKRRK